MCHHTSGSTKKIRVAENTHPTRNVPSIAGNENIHFPASSAFPDAFFSATAAPAINGASAASHSAATKLLGRPLISPAIPALAPPPQRPLPISLAAQTAPSCHPHTPVSTPANAPALPPASHSDTTD